MLNIQISGESQWFMKSYELTRTRACTGFDRGFAAGEAIRMQCVKWQT